MGGGNSSVDRCSTRHKVTRNNPAAPQSPIFSDRSIVDGGSVLRGVELRSVPTFDQTTAPLMASSVKIYGTLNRKNGDVSITKLMPRMPIKLTHSSGQESSLRIKLSTFSPDRPMTATPITPSALTKARIMPIAVIFPCSTTTTRLLATRAKGLRPVGEFRTRWSSRESLGPPVRSHF